MKWRQLSRRLQRLSGSALAGLGAALALLQFALAWILLGGADLLLGDKFDAISLPHAFSPFDLVALANAIFCALAGLIQGITARRIVLEWHWRHYRQAQARCLAAGAFYLAVAALWIALAFFIPNSVAGNLSDAPVCVERDLLAAALTLLLPATAFSLAAFGFSRHRNGTPEAEF